MITLTFTPENDEYAEWLTIEAWFFGARVACVKKEASSSFHKLNMGGFDTPETPAEMTALAQPILNNLQEHFTK